MKTPEEEVAEFNANEIGIEVTYRPGAEGGELKTRTVKRAQVVDKRAVVWVEGHTGCVPLSRVLKIA